MDRLHNSDHKWPSMSDDNSQFLFFEQKEVFGVYCKGVTAPGTASRGNSAGG